MLWLIIAVLISGLFVGALGRLVVPGRQRMGLLATAFVGVAGSLAGGLLGHLVFGWRYRYSYLLALLLAVACTAAIIAVLQAPRGRQRLP